MKIRVVWGVFVEKNLYIQFSNSVFLVKKPSEFVFACCEFTKVILSPKSGINVCVKALIMVYNKTLLTFLKL